MIEFDSLRRQQQLLIDMFQEVMTRAKDSTSSANGLAAHLQEVSMATGQL